MPKKTTKSSHTSKRVASEAGSLMKSSGNRKMRSVARAALRERQNKPKKR